jgi:hypothetical protein
VTAQALGNILLVVSALEATVFVLVYHFTATWWRSWPGRNLMGLWFVIAVVLDTSATRALLGASLDTPWFAALRLGVFCGVPLILGASLYGLVKIQVIDRARDRRHRRLP